MNLIYGRDAYVASWVANKLRLPDASFFAPYTAVGIVENLEIKGGVIYNNYREDAFKKPISIEISGASIDKRCAMRHIIRPLLAYPFAQLKVGRVQLSIAKPNMVARHFAERL